MSSATGSYGVTEWLNRQLCYARIDGNDQVYWYCEELLRLAAGGWRDITTAPRDGTKILLARVRSDGTYEWMYVAWCRHTQWRIAENVARIYYSTVGSDPTHWQPLPAPPAAVEDTTEGER